MHSQLLTLCRELRFPEAVTAQILSCSRGTDWASLKPAMDLLVQPEHWDAGLEQLKAQLGDDPEGFRMLTCQLIRALDTRSRFRQIGIPEEIFLATMGCFPRFVREHKESFGFYGFDREWWTVRQLSGVLFRIGLLEYELRDQAVSLHIPSGCPLIPQAVSDSLEEADIFLTRFFPKWAELPFVCHSWLLSPTLKALLDEDSRIVQFQDRFDITPTGTDDRDFLIWAFRNQNIPLSQLPENTSLQRRLKAHLLAGKPFLDARGTLKENRRHCK